MTADEFKALQENADMILNTLREAEISDDEDDEEHCGMSNGDMLDDETMSLVSNESDEEFLSPDSNMHPQIQKQSPKSDHRKLQPCNGMIALPQSSVIAPSKYVSRKTSLPQMAAKNKPISNGYPRTDEHVQKNRYSYPAQNQVSSNIPHFSESPKKVAGSLKANHVNENTFSRIKPPGSNRKPIDSFCGNDENHVVSDYLKTPEEQPPGGFDSRTFTRKKSSVPKGMIPSIQSVPHAGSLRSPSSHNIPSLPGSCENVAPVKTVESRIAGVWKTGKVRSKSMVDPNRNSKLRLEKSASTGNAKDEIYGASQLDRYVCD